MAIPPRPIGQDPQSQLLWNISKQLEQLTQITLQLPSGAATEATLSDINTRDSDIALSGSVVTATPFTINVDAKGTYTFNASGTWSGSVIIEASLDGTTWVPTTFVALASGNASSTFSAPTSGQINTVGLDYIRFRSNTIASGSVTIIGLATRLVSNVMLDNAIPTGSNVIGSINNLIQLNGAAISMNTGVRDAGTQRITIATDDSVPVVGKSAHSAAVSGNPVYMAGKVLPTTAATADLTLVAGDAAGAPVTTGQQLAVKPFGTAELDFTSIFSTVGTTVTVQPIVPASGTASVRNYITNLIINTDAIGAAGLIWLLDGAVSVTSIAITTGLVTTSAAHDLKVGDSVVFTALAGGTGVTVNTMYFVTSVGSTTTFNFSTTTAGSNVVPSVAYTGTTMYRILYQTKLQTAGIPTPVTINFTTPLRCNGNVVTNFLIPTSLTSGSIYLSINGYRGF